MATDEEIWAAEDAEAVRLHKAIAAHSEFAAYLKAEEIKHGTSRGDAYLADECVDIENALDAGLVYGSAEFWEFCRSSAESAAVDRATDLGIFLPRIMRKKPCK